MTMYTAGSIYSLLRKLGLLSGSSARTWLACLQREYLHHGADLTRVCYNQNALARTIMALALLQVRMLVRGDCPVEDLVLTPCTAFRSSISTRRYLVDLEKATK